MKDNELLELAAKAAGIEIVGKIEKYIAQYEDRYIGGFIVRNDRGGDSSWNPLGDDGDALRLAVKLGIDIGFGFDDRGNVICAVIYSDPEYVSDNNGSPYAATRRAIVRAAAEIGKAME